jgi:hypothetical protein
MPSDPTFVLVRTTCPPICWTHRDRQGQERQRHTQHGVPARQVTRPATGAPKRVEGTFKRDSSRTKDRDPAHIRDRQPKK